MYLNKVYPPPPRSWPRVLGTYTSGQSDPVLVAIGGIHGNEPAGPWAIQNILHVLRSGIGFRGTFVGLAGNLAAMKLGRRYIDADLNRVWACDIGQTSNADVMGSEWDEYRILRQHLHDIMHRSTEPITVVDLHSSSADGPPFLLTGTSARHRALNGLFPIPRICGLIEKLNGILIHFAVSNGHRGFVFEGGQHRRAETLDHLTTCLWLLLIEMGCVRHEDIPDLEASVTNLKRTSGNLPASLAVVHRHAIHAGDRFQMAPGYRNFDHVFRGEVLAWDRDGEIVSPVDGRILLPLYQGQGNDGFFVGVELED